MLKTIIFKLDPDIVLKKYLTTKLKLLWLFSTITLVMWLYTTTLVWWQILVIFYIGVIYYRFTSEVIYHRYFAHRSFEILTFQKNIFLIISSLIGTGSCISWVAMHRAHHAYSDTDRDPHSPLNEGILRSFLTMRRKKNDALWKFESARVKDLVRDPLQVLIHKNYFKILLFWITSLLAISYLVESMIILILLFSLPCFLSWIMSGVTNSLGHYVGYQNFNTSDNSRNQNFPRWLFLSSGLHNNHHYSPNSCYLNLKNRWWEFDFDYLLVKIIKNKD